MILPDLTDWTDTRTGLHAAAQVIGGVRAATAAPEPNYTHLGLISIPAGLSTGRLPFGGEVVLNFARRRMIVEVDGQTPAEIPVDGQTPLALADAVDQTLAALVPGSVRLNRSKISRSDPIRIDPRQAEDYAALLALVSRVLRRLRDSLPGEKSRLVIWPHGFDTSFLWFATAHASEDAPHQAFGFSPASPGIDRPYFYAYVHPLPPDLTARALPSLARWHSAGWTGIVLPYDDLRPLVQPEMVIEGTLRALHDLLLPV